MANTVGQAYVQILPTTKGIKQDVENQLNNQISGPAKSAGRVIGGALKAGAIAGLAGLGAMIGKSIMEGANLEQQLGGSKAVFGKYSKDLVEMSKISFQEMGLSQNDFLQGVNKMGSLFQGAGHDVKSSMSMSADYIQRASDVASIMGIDTSSALEAVSAAAKGNFTMMDNLGVAMNATTLEAYAMEKGINKSWNSMTNQEKTGLAYQMFMEKTAKYAGNYAKENDTLAGSLNTLRTGFSTLLGQLAQGQDFTKTMDGLKETSKKFVSALTDTLKNIGKELPSIISELTPFVNELLNTLIPTLLPIVITGLTSLMSAVIQNIPLLFKMVLEQIPSLAQSLIDTFMQQDIGGKLALGLVAGFAAVGAIKKIKDLLMPLSQMKMPAAAGAGTFLTSLATGLKAFANPQVILGAGGLAAAMVILSAGVWASIKIVSNALPDLGTALGSFNGINGGNLLKVGLGLSALAVGLLAITAGSIVNGLASLVGGGFGNALKSIIEPVSTLMPKISLENISKFHLLGSGLAALGVGFASVKGINATNVTSSIDAVTKKIATLNNFDFETTTAKLKEKAKTIGKEIVNGIVSGINTNAYKLNISISTKIDEMVAAAIKKAEIGSPSKLFEREVGYWLGAGVGTGFSKGAKDYQPEFFDTYRNNLGSMDLANNQKVVMPDTFRIVDSDGFEMKIKAIVDDKIIMNNINKGWSG